MKGESLSQRYDKAKDKYVRRSDSVRERLRKQWAKWAKERSVKPWGICAAWKQGQHKEGE